MPNDEELQDLINNLTEINIQNPVNGHGDNGIMSLPTVPVLENTDPRPKDPDPIKKPKFIFLDFFKNKYVLTGIAFLILAMCLFPLFNRQNKIEYFNEKYKNCSSSDYNNQIAYLDSLWNEARKTPNDSIKYNIWVPRALDSIRSLRIFKGTDFNLNQYIEYFTKGSTIFYKDSIISKLKTKNQSFVWTDEDNISYPVISDGSKLWFDTIYRGSQKIDSIGFFCPRCKRQLILGAMYYRDDNDHNGSRHNFSGALPAAYYNSCSYHHNDYRDNELYRYKLPIKDTINRYLDYDTLSFPPKWRLPKLNDIESTSSLLILRKNPFIIAPEDQNRLSHFLDIFNPKTNKILPYDNNRYGYIYLMMDIYSLTGENNKITIQENQAKVIDDKKINLKEEKKIKKGR